MDRRSMLLHGFLMNLLVPTIESWQELSTPNDKSYMYTGLTNIFLLEKKFKIKFNSLVKEILIDFLTKESKIIEWFIFEYFYAFTATSFIF